jgi:hypothetical protein
MASQCVAVVVSGAQGVPALRRWLPDDAAVSVYADSDALRALAAIQASPPKLLLLDRGFAMTARGAALVATIKDTPELANTELRVLAAQDVHLDGRLTRSPMAELLKASRRLDESGTRSAVRFVLSLHVSVLVNGYASELLDLSCDGARVVTSVRLVPNQQVQMLISDDELRALCRGTVAWSAVASAAVVLYRTGVRFEEAETEAIQALCNKYGRRI